MNIFKMLFEFFIFYLLYKLVFEFIMPIYRASKHMKDQVGQMQQKMQEQQQRQAYAEDSFVNNATSKPAPEKASGKDYIDFEEVK
jgi:hypothetical protein